MDQRALKYLLITPNFKFVTHIRDFEYGGRGGGGIGRRGRSGGHPILFMIQGVYKLISFKQNFSLLLIQILKIL